MRRRKPPLLRSMEAVCKQAVRICRLFWDPQTQRVIASVGAGKEYFIANRENYLKRKNVMKKVALQLRLVCLLHEKPFAGVNGSPDIYHVIKRSIRQRKGRFFHALTAF